MNFSEKVYELCKQIPKGKVTTYKELSRALNTKAFQAVGQALRKNPYAPIVPCHRIVNVKGELHGFKGQTKGKEIQEKKELLKKEGVSIKNNKIDLNKYMFTF
jgi:methylated-DNA-[protein]-cysteine S-methyltransferase